MIKLCWHKWSNWIDPIQTYKGNLQQWKCCSKCNKSSFRNLPWHNQTELSAVIKAINTARGEL